MANVKTIESNLQSVSDIQQMTRAWEVVSSVKLQKIKKATEQYKTFMQDFLDIVSAVQHATNIFDVPYVWTWRKLLVVLSSDKWVCWDLDQKLFKQIAKKYGWYKRTIDVFCVWKKAFEFFAGSWFTVVWYTHLSDEFTEMDLQNLNTYISNAIDQQAYDKIKVYFNSFKNTVTQLPIRCKLYPLDQQNLTEFIDCVGINYDTSSLPVYNDIWFGPDMQSCKEALSKQLLQHMLYWAVLHNKTGEFASRMLTMKAAQDNASLLLKSLKVSFNKARQSLLTKNIWKTVWTRMAIS